MVDHVQCSSIPRVLNGHCGDTAHADKVEPGFYVLGYIFKARRRDCLKAGFLALPPDIHDECLIDVQRWSIFRDEDGRLVEASRRVRMERPARASPRAWRAERPWSRPVAMTDKASA